MGSKTELIMQVTKADGSSQEFKPEKVIDACVRAGLSASQAKGILEKILPEIYNGMTTREIFDIVRKQIEALDDRSAYFIRLRDAISDLDPVSFEIYAKKILDTHGFTTSLNRIIRGRYVEHEVDVVAAAEGRTYLIECKHHHNPHRFTGLGTCLQVMARMEDINAESQVFDSAWIFTNNKFSDHAKTYSAGAGIRLTGWKSGGRFSIEHMIQKQRIFPVTILNISRKESESLLKEKIVTVQDLIFSEKETDAAREAEKLLSFKSAVQY
jgi:hypothetical protein